jgi:hypothetical protein
MYAGQYVANAASTLFTFVWLAWLITLKTRTWQRRRACDGLAIRTLHMHYCLPAFSHSHNPAARVVRCRARRHDTAVTPTSSLPLHRLVCHLLGLVRRMFCVAAPVASNPGENQEGELKFESGRVTHACSSLCIPCSGQTFGHLLRASG